MLKSLNFTQIEIDFIKQYGNLTPREEQILEIRNQEDPPTVENIAEMWDCSVSTVNKSVRSLKDKILRLL